MHDGLDSRPGNQFRPHVPPSASAGDFLGLEAELGRIPPRAAPTPPHAPLPCAPHGYAPQPHAQSAPQLGDTQYAAHPQHAPYGGHVPHVLPQPSPYGMHAHPAQAAHPVGRLPQQQYAQQFHAPTQHAPQQHAPHAYGHVPQPPYVEPPRAPIPPFTHALHDARPVVEQPHAPRPIAPPPARPRAMQQVLMPPQELLPPQQALAGTWPEVRPNTWRVGAQPPPPLAQPSAPANANPNVNPTASAVDPSWLLELDDAAIPPAHPSFVASSAPANASFHDGTAVAHRVAPWFVRALCVAAGLFLCAVITRTVLVRSSKEPAAPQAPVQPIARSTPRVQHELVAPNEADELARGRPGQRVKKPANASMTSAASTGERSFLERDAPLDAQPESPALVVYDLPDSASRAVTGAPLDRADADRWLAEQSRASAPLSDVGAVRASEPSLPGEASPTSAGASGIWEGATIPVESLAGGLRLTTPGVGRVRVRLEGGTRAEGQLTAIGQGRVWIETESGPMVIESSKMRGLEQIAERGASSGPQSPKRQRVRTEGGVFFGRVLARDGRTVTLITDAGTRLTVEADEVEDVDADAPAGSRRTDR